MHRPFNSTRCIRNEDFAKALQCKRRDFQLHTVHQEQVKHWVIEALKRHFQLHTVHQEQRQLLKFFLSVAHFQLHTVHQEHLKEVNCWFNVLTFNSTRCIRNFCTHKGRVYPTVLSTPHGALGTFFIWVKQNCLVGPFNSTRCIRNASLQCQKPKTKCFQLHTVHQELTYYIQAISHPYPFNSTRCIRNFW